MRKRKWLVLLCLAVPLAAAVTFTRRRRQYIGRQ